MELLGPNQELLATAGDDGVIRISDVETQSFLYSLVRPQPLAGADDPPDPDDPVAEGKPAPLPSISALAIPMTGDGDDG